MIQRVSVGIVAVLLAVASAAAHPGLHHDIDRASEAIEKNPAQADLYVERAYLERLDDRLAEALTDLDRARTLDPANLRVAAERGMTLSAMGRNAEADEELTRFVDGNGGTAPTLAERAKVRERLGRKKAAVADYSSAIASRPDIEFYMARGALQESLGDLKGAAEGYTEGVAQLGDAVNLDLALIRVETSRKRYREALDLIDKQIARSPVKTDWYLRRADVLEAAGKKQQARGEREKALEEANRAVEQNPSGLRLFARAKVYAALGQFDAAEQDLKIVLEKSPRFAEAQELVDRLSAADNDKGKKP